MSFVGVIVTNKDFEFIKKIIYKEIKDKIKVIRITKNNIENIKNVKFDTIVICKEMEEIIEKQKVLKQIVNNAKYLIINTDVNINKELFSKIRIKIITYGLNRKATLTVSSIGEDELMLCLQRSIENLEKDIIEPYEVNIKSKKINDKKIYNIIAAHSILTLYNGKNVVEFQKKIQKLQKNNFLCRQRWKNVV